MESDAPFSGTLKHINAHWPTYLGGYGGAIALALALILFASGREWWGLLLVAVVVLLVTAYFLLASLWATHQQVDLKQNQPAAVLFRLGRLQPTESFVHVGLGVQETPVRLSRHLTSGCVTAVDVYNPQLAPSRPLARRRQQSRPPRNDPRLTWSEGSINLLPLPDSSTNAVTISHTLTELRQHGDRQRLLQEIHRILSPGGQLILAEPVRTRTNWLVGGIAALRMESLPYWRRLLSETGFHLRQEQNVRNFYYCFRVEKPLPGEVQQLTLDLGV
ncbi:MAG TPA: class I SAM-dependent methyltransferase [Candidatus Sulfomarinibacteraceae bacterium]|nr:class I SAM-dependent methyltransferase [Candidatus Sulfomarinibacteraceae bacterium]